MHYGMAIDLQLCFGCTECAVACKSNNNLPNNMWWNRVLTDGGDYPDTAKGTYPQVSMAHYPVGCQHCANPACAKVCPVGATWRDEKTGIVVQDVDKCIGCRMCMGACPYSARTFNWEEPAYAVDFPLGDFDAPSTLPAWWRSAPSAPTALHAAKSPPAWSTAPDERGTGAIWTIPTATCRARSQDVPPFACWKTKARSLPCTTWRKGVPQ